MAFTEKDFVQLVTYTRVEYYCTMSVLAMVIYDCITRVSSEIDLVWTRRFTPYWLLYFMCRYPPILVMVLNWLRLSNVTACHPISIVYVISSMQVAIMPAAFGALRLYAVTNRDLRVSLFALILGLMPICIDILYFSRSRFMSVPLPNGRFRCSQEDLLSNSLTLRLVIVTRSCMVIFDIFVMSVLWYKCREVWRTSQIARQQHSLTQHLLKDGTLLFLFLLVINILHVILWLTIDFQWTTTLFLQPISCTLICRCLLNLREATNPPQTTADLDTIDIDVLFAHSTSEDLETLVASERGSPTAAFMELPGHTLAMNSQDRE